jgi:hypothetical protein
MTKMMTFFRHLPSSVSSSERKYWLPNETGSLEETFLSRDLPVVLVGVEWTGRGLRENVQCNVHCSEDNFLGGFIHPHHDHRHHFDDGMEESNMSGTFSNGIMSPESSLLMSYMSVDFLLISVWVKYKGVMGTGIAWGFIKIIISLWIV